MPFIIHIFAVFAFALGLAEFGQIGLLDIIADGMNTSPENIGKLVSAYALGATVSAPILTALSANLSRKAVMLITTAVFSLGSLITSFGIDLTTMIIARFVAGLGHGLFLAAATSTAARLAGKARAGSAVALVFTGFTVAMAIGVPGSTYLGGVMDWRWVMSFIAFFGVIGFIGLMLGMEDPLKTEVKINPIQNIKLLANKALLRATSVTFFAYSGAFATYTYIAPFVVDIAKESAEMISLYMLLFGIFAAIGNIIGGKLTDKLGIKAANIWLIALLAISSALFSLLGSSPICLKMMVSALGFFTFGIVPSLHAFLINEAHKQGDAADSVAVGLNIAGFNFAIAAGSTIGGFVMSHIGVAFVGYAGAMLSMLGLIVFLALNRR